MNVYPYAVTSIPNETLPWIEDTPTISNVIVLLLGVKTTLNKLAVKLELSWQVLRDFDSINLMAETPDRREEKESKVTTGDNIESLMMAVVC
jgi:hypothetical protein